MVVYRLIYLHESKLFKSVNHMDEKLEAQAGGSSWSLTIRKHLRAWYYFWPRQLVASAAWIANDFAFYGKHQIHCVLFFYAGVGKG
jgi:hypothetical protein